MKKFLLFPLFVCSLLAVPEISFAGCNSPVVLGFDGNQAPADDEFLYETKEQFLLTKQGFTNTGKQSSGSGRGYECDEINSPSCTIDDVIEMPAGHVFKGEVIPNARRYQCQIGSIWGDDKWVVVDDNTCSTKGFGDILVGKCVSDGNGCRSLTAIDCSGYELTDVNGTVFIGICRDGPKFVCKAIECREGMRADNGICVIDNAKQDEQEEEQEKTATTPAPVTKVSCTQRYGCYNLPADKQKACVACCSVSASVANWNQNTQICECVNKSQTFNPDTKVCSGGDTVSAPVVIAPTEPEKYDCDISKLLELRAKHSTNSEIVSLIDELIEKCEEGITETEYNSLYINITVVITNIRDAGLSSSRTNILNAISKLDNLSSGFKESVWKNEEGEFNTSRLISDSVAGVVLGTAGGLITSSVVKKNQVENGFEDIQCTVGGQVVAGWGDQFQVGIQ